VKSLPTLWTDTRAAQPFCHAVCAVIAELTELLEASRRRVGGLRSKTKGLFSNDSDAEDEANDQVVLLQTRRALSPRPDTFVCTVLDCLEYS
jgi:hypothetical protein